jgi:integrase
MAIYQRGKNWYIDFTFKGQRIRESIGHSRRNAKKVMAKKETEIIENKYLDIRKEPEPIAFFDFAKQYLQWSKANKKATSHVRDLCSMRVLNGDFEKQNIHEITTWQIEKYKAKRKEKVKPATVNREIALIKHMYTKAIEWGRCRDNPAKKVKLLKGEVKRLRFLMPGEVQTLLSNCARHLRPIVTVAIHTGMRRSEILMLRRDQANLEQGIISILDTKNHERKDIPINETVKAVLKGVEDRGEYFFCNRQGKPYGDIKESFQAALKKSGIEDFRFHDLRHTFASNLVMAGEDLNTVRELMGHKNMSMTLRYAHLAPGKKARAVNVLDRVMSQNPPQEEKTKKVVSLMPQSP